MTTDFPKDRNDPRACPHCHVVQDGALDMDDPNAVPTAGALSLCISCGKLSVFRDNQMGKRLPTTEEWRGILNDRKVQKLVTNFHVLRLTERFQKRP